MAEAARRLDLPLAEVGTVKEGPGFDRLATAHPDVLVVVAYGEILPPAVLELPRVAPVNLHFSLLPQLRGPAPVQRAILEGLAETVVSTMVMAQGVDAGDVLLRESTPIRPEDDAGSLGDRLAELGAGLLVLTLDGLADGDLQPQPQDESNATRAPKLGPGERWIDWTEDAPAVVRRVRALSPDPAASTTFRGGVLKVFRAQADERNGPPGSVLEAGKDGFVVGSGSGAVRPLEVAPEGRRRMSGQEFVRGYRPHGGEVLGAPIA